MPEQPNAGVGVDRPQPSRLSDPFDGSRPLQAFIKALPQMRAAMASCGVTAFSFSPLNALPKIALGKWEIIEKADVLVVRTAQGHRVIPCGDRGAYYSTVLELLGEKHDVSHVPEWLANAIKGHHKVARQGAEYLMTTEAVQTFPGGHNRQVRGNVNKARRLCTVEHFHPDQLDEYAALVKTWYRQNVELKFRTYDKTSIDWLLENWSDLKQTVPDMTCLGIRYEGVLISLNMGCLLADGMWTAYTQRFDREAAIKHGNMLGYNELAKVFADTPMENDGTADTKTIKEWKDRLVHSKFSTFQVST